mmetsp:Transcript_17424/g.44623  ORF Transcript_17424/g.44623 Transcript_17424/m.44623 type:complete len:217 (+) Transcript_17424:408-1058(+)
MRVSKLHSITRTPRESSASVCERSSSSSTEECRYTRSPSPLDTLTTRPNPRLRMRASAAAPSAAGAAAFTRSARAYARASCPGSHTAALLTTRATGCASMCSTSSRRRSKSPARQRRRSSGQWTARPGPTALHTRASSPRADSALRAVNATRWPRLASSATSSAPIPPVPPVTRQASPAAGLKPCSAHAADSSARAQAGARRALSQRILIRPLCTA